MKKSVLEFWVGLFVLLGVVAIGFLSFRVAGGNALPAARAKPTPCMPNSPISAA